MTKLVQIPEKHWVPLGRRFVIRPSEKQSEIDDMVSRAHTFWKEHGQENTWIRNPGGMGFLVPVNELSEVIARVRKSAKTQNLSITQGRILLGRDGDAVLPILSKDKVQRVSRNQTAEPIPRDIMTPVYMTGEQWALVQNALQYHADRIQNAPTAAKLRDIQDQIAEQTGDRATNSTPLRVVR